MSTKLLNIKTFSKKKVSLLNAGPTKLSIVIKLVRMLINQIRSLNSIEEINRCLTDILLMGPLCGKGDCALIW